LCKAGIYTNIFKIKDDAITGTIQSKGYMSEEDLRFYIIDIQAAIEIKLKFSCLGIFVA
jgi:hypothetical protein